MRRPAWRTCQSYFNPRSPHGERRFAGQPCQTAPVFQSTLPARGATLNFVNAILNRVISIHAPRTGSDISRSFLSVLQVDFNPRSPHGERLDLSSFGIVPNKFQSTLPARGATSTTNGMRLTSRFQSTLPARGATDCHTESVLHFAFQSTLPARGATAQSNNSVDQNHRLCTKSIPQNSPFEN